MVVFKKPSRPVPTSSSQTPRSPEKTGSESNTTVVPKQHSPTADKLPPARLRYSDITAGRDAKDNDTHIEKLMYIPELCDEVFDYLSMDELLHATRVCRAFKTNIENSSLLQARLFIAPDLTMKKLAVSATGTLLSGVKAEQRIIAAETTGNVESGEIVLYIPHPQLEPGYVSDRYKRMGMVKFASVCVETCRSREGAKLNFRDVWTVLTLPETSSLHKMLVCQPPTKEVSALFSSFGINRPSLTLELKISNEAGVTIGDVVSALRNAPGWPDDLDLRKSFCNMTFKGGFVVNSLARSVAERSAELSSENDPTRLVKRGEPLMAGRFPFISQK